MPTKWLDRTQPQTLMIATILMYVNAAFGVLDLFSGGIFSLVLLAEVFGGLGIANERKAGYWLALVLAILPLLLVIKYHEATSVISLIFEIGLVALLLHPQSRAYKRTWFH